MNGYYFSASNRLRYGDGRTIEQGITHTVDVTPRCCHAGLHASKNPLDALGYGYGSWCWYVSVSGQVHEQSDKFCGQRREYLWGFDAEDVLRAFARRCALDVIHLWEAPPAVVDYLKTGDESSQAAAGAAAWAARAAGAVGASAWAAWAAWAAWEAARGGARGAARDAAWAARDAAWDARGTARYAARAKQNRRLIQMLHAGAKK